MYSVCLLVFPETFPFLLLYLHEIDHVPLAYIYVCVFPLDLVLNWSVGLECWIIVRRAPQSWSARKVELIYVLELLHWAVFSEEVRCCSIRWVLKSGFHVKKDEEPHHQGVEPNLNPNRKPEWTVLFSWTRTEPEAAKFYFRVPEPNLNP